MNKQEILDKFENFISFCIGEGYAVNADYVEDIRQYLSKLDYNRDDSIIDFYIDNFGRVEVFHSSPISKV